MRLTVDVRSARNSSKEPLVLFTSTRRGFWISLAMAFWCS